MKPTQRFVAGASCPACNQEDSLLIDSEDQSIECVDCGFTQSPQARDEKSSQTAKTAKVNTGDIIQIKNLSDE